MAMFDQIGSLKDALAVFGLLEAYVEQNIKQIESFSL